jgi:peptide chain release factor 1
LPLLTDPDPDFRTLALADDTALRTSLTRAVSTTFPRLLLQDDANGTKHLGAMVELKAGVGGAESSLFCEEMLRMYERVAGLMGPPAPYDPTLDDLDVDSGGSSASSSNAATTPKTPKWGRWQVSVAGRNVMEGGGLREGVLEVKGEGAYDALRWESGVHRVQRVPATETGGRTHTSTVAVVVSSANADPNAYMIYAERKSNYVDFFPCRFYL